MYSKYRPSSRLEWFLCPCLTTLVTRVGTGHVGRVEHGNCLRELAQGIALLQAARDFVSVSWLRQVASPPSPRGRHSLSHNLTQAVARLGQWKNHLSVPSAAAFPRLAMATPWRFSIGGAGKRGATVAVAVVLLATALHPLIVKLRRRKNSPRSGTLKVLSDPYGAKFEFVDPAPSSHGPR